MNVHAYLDTVDSPIGVLALAADADGSLLAVRLPDGERDGGGRARRGLAGELEVEGFVVHAAVAAAGSGTGTTTTAEPTDRARGEIAEYFAGTRRTFDVPLVLRGSAFQRDVWQELLNIPFGETRSYADIAKGLGKPGAYRAVGRANATNRIPLVVPCHRVIGADGGLTGYGGGLGIKERLLRFEGALGCQDGNPERSQARNQGRGRRQRSDVIPGLETV